MKIISKITACTLFALSLSLMSCSEETCEIAADDNYNEGACDETATTSKFAADYDASVSCTNGAEYQDTVTITQSVQDYKINIVGLYADEGMQADVSQNTFEIPNQLIGQDVPISGNGTLVNDNLSITYTHNDGGIVNCTCTATKL